MLRSLGNNKPLVLPSSKKQQQQGQGQGQQKTRPTLKTFLTMARFIARTKVAAREWAKQEAVRKKLAAAAEETRRAKRSHRLKVVRVDDDGQTC